MALFLSTFDNKIDKKGRVSVPAQFRASLANQDFAGIIVYESFINDCIEGCDISRIKHLSESIDNLDPFSESRDSFAASILGSAIQLSFDGDGRVTLPESLIRKIGLQDKAVFIGKGTTFEIWQPNKFTKYLEKAKISARENRSQLKLSKKDF
ncbi:MAG: MraZ protein [Myxococcota bacterium]|jgi:MraZ protein